jgi:hypothetical protein
MIDYLSNLPGNQLATLVCLSFVGITWLGAIFIRPFFRVLVRTQPDLNSLIGNFVSMYGIFYGILMGLLAVAAYQNKAGVEEAIVTEGAALFALYRNVSAYPEAVRQPLQESVRDYTQFVIDAEWPAMRKGEIFAGGMPLINHLQQLVTGYEPATEGQKILHSETTRQFYRFLELRSKRLYSATAGIPGIMWYVVILGAFVSIFLTWLLNMSLVAHLFLGGVLSFFIGTMVSLILVLDRPLRGEFGISPEVFQLLLKFMNTMLGQPAG